MPRDKQYTPEEIEQKFDQYIDYCVNYKKEVVSNSGKKVEVTGRVMTLGEFLNLYLKVDFSTWQNYRGAEGYEEYFPTIKGIDDFIEGNKGAALVNGEGNTSGIIFDLKANRWAREKWIDKQTIDQNLIGDGIKIVIDRDE